MNTFLHVGCGPNRKESTTPEFAGAGWQELRLDIDPDCQPDFVGSMTDMSAVADASVDAIYSAHSIEHLYAHEIPTALAEFVRVLKPEGYVVITCPDLQSVAALVAAGKLTDTIYDSPAGPVTPFDMLYGHRLQLAAGKTYMAHRSGFTMKALQDTLGAHGFPLVAARQRGEPDFDLWAVASKSARPQEELIALAQRHFPA